MKKCVSFVLAMLLLLMSVQAGAQTDTKQVIRVTGLGIMVGDETGEFREDDPVTRAEMATIAIRLKGIDDEITMGTETGFTDVPTEHWASGAIAYAQALGVMEGNGDGTFSPDEPLTFEQIAKILVCILGYEPAADQLGGYPLGYTMEAAVLGITRDVDSSKESVTRLDVAKMIDRALDIVPMVQNYDGAYQKDEYNETLYDQLTQKKETVRVKGILTETEYSSLDNIQPSVDEGFIRVDGNTYRTAEDMTEYLGYQMDGYAQRDENTDEYEIITLRPVQGRNEVHEINAQDAEISANRLEWYLDEGGKEYVTLAASTKYLVNGRLCADGNWQTYYGMYTTIDNNNDGVAEVVSVQAAESFVVDRVNLDTNTIYFMNERLYRNSPGFRLDDDLDVQIQITNAAGEEIALEDIQAGNSITLLVSQDEMKVRIVINDESVQGKIESIEDEDTVVINGQEYTVAVQEDGSLVEEFEVGDEAQFALDMFHHIAGTNGTKITNLSYGYIVEAGSEGGVMGTGKAVRIVTGIAPEKEVKVTGGNEVISYYFQNDEIRLYQLEQKVRFNDTSVAASSIADNQLAGKIVAYSLNGAGNIRELYTYDIPTLKSYEFNAKIKSFGGESVDRGFFTDDNTMFVCVPVVADEDEDYAIRLKLTDGSTGNKVYGIRSTPLPVSGNLTEAQRQERINAQPVNILVIQGEMDASQPQVIPSDSDICMVGEIKQSTGTIRDDVDSPVYRLTLLNDDEIVEEVTQSGGPAYTVASGLRKGDLIRYVKDGFGRIVNIEKLASVQGLTEYGEVAANVGVGYYGIAEDVALDTFDYQSNEKVDLLTMSFDGRMESKTLRIFLDEGQPVYMYERGTGWVYPATSELVESLAQAGTDATKLYAQMENNDVTALVIIKD